MSDRNNDQINDSRIKTVNSDKSSSGQETSHPICQGANDLEKCERFGMTVADVVAPSELLVDRILR